MAAPLRYAALVLGLGALGLSTLWQLARRGARVLGLDAAGVPNTQGSSHGQSRAFRLAYFEHPGYVPLLQRALAGWRELEAAAGGAPLLTLSGGLYIGRDDSEIVTGCAAAARLHGLEYELLDEAALRRGWPQFAFFEGAAAVHEPHAGVCQVEATLIALAALARAAGAKLHAREPVLDWSADRPGSCVRVVTAAGVYETERLVICPGAYANAVVKAAAVQIMPTRQVVGWFTPRQPRLAGPERLPVWAAQLPDGQFWYGFAALPGSPGLKLGRHQPGRVVDPATEPRTAAPAEERELRSFAARWLPDAAGELAASSICLYENSPDGHFILDWHPQHGPGVAGEPGQVLLGCGGSGHAFKFTPVLGEILADLALDGATRHDIAFLSLGRLSAGA